MAQNILLAFIIGLTSAVGRAFLSAPDADLIDRIEALEAACDTR